MIEKIYNISEEDFTAMLQISSAKFLKIEYVNLISRTSHSIVSSNSQCFDEASVFSDDLERYRHFIASDRISNELDKLHPCDELEIRYIDDDGTLLYLNVKISVLKFQENTPAAYIISVENITERVLRTRKIFKELNTSFKEMVQANSAKNEFLLRMSHDIRTPINAIIGMTALIKNLLYGENQALNYLNNIENAAQLLITMFNETLDMSVIESGKLELHDELIDLKAFLNDLVSLVSSSISEKQHELTVDISELHSFFVYADRNYLSQCILNFISNAVKYTPCGGKISLTLKELTDASSAASNVSNFIFTVEDNGIGMSPDFLNHISTPFARDITAEKAGIHGTGLGMSISYKIISAMNGTVDVASALGSGTSFTITLPLKLAPQEDVNTTSVSHTSFDATDIFSMYSFSGKTFLIADDDNLNIEILYELLTLAGAHVDTASNGEIAVNKFKASPENYYDLIILDIRMPILDGYEAAHAIRESSRSDSNTIPIIAFTANTVNDTVQAAQNSEIQEFITKPLNTEYLFGTITSLLANK